MGELSRSGVTEGALSDPLTRATSPKGRGKEAISTHCKARVHTARGLSLQLTILPSMVY